VTGTPVGTTIEWYDFCKLRKRCSAGYRTAIFSAVPPENQLIVSFATVGVSFLFRSLGAIVAGHLGDLVGRKAMLVATLLLMGAATTLIGVLPTAAAIGIWAPILLVFLRCVQGFSAGYQIGFIALLVWVIPFLLLIDRASVFLIFVALLVLTFGIGFTYGRKTLFSRRCSRLRSGTRVVVSAMRLGDLGWRVRPDHRPGPAENDGDESVDRGLPDHRCFDRLRRDLLCEGPHRRSPRRGCH